MGIPKFYRWISERYPCLSEKVKEYQIPEFDNLYLDMNGIIHTCSHPNDEDVHLRIPEHDVFRDIFRYLDFLFKMIKPRKVFLMAVDGVAPRAKMNQQRGRRFRSAKEAEDKEEEARKKGEVLPSEARFDSNCITPGTEFMAKLHDQLRYFVQVKVSTDPLWQTPGLAIILSGHDVPGEGEHKIMDYIRHLRSDPAYDPETRHCLYGLDADLIMLGLSTHELRFSLLREEVKFGRQRTNKKRKKTGPATGVAPNPCDLTNVSAYVQIDEAVLSDSKTVLTNASTVVDGQSYSEILQTQPEANEVGSDNGLNVDALLTTPTNESLKNKDTYRPPLPEKTTFYLLHLSLLRDYIDEEFKGLREALDKNSQVSYNLENVIDDWVLLNILVGNDFVPHLPHLHIVKGGLPKLYAVYMQVLPTLDGYLNENGYLNLPRFEALLHALSVLDIEVFRETFEDMVYLENKTGVDIVLDKLFEVLELKGFDDSHEFLESKNEDDDESLSTKPEVAVEQVFAGYDEFMDEEDNPKFRKEYLRYKQNYYQEKLNIKDLSRDTLNRFTEEYVKAVQWILLYYYKGVSSWGWFYPYHYSPFTSDIKDFSAMKVEFELGEPFKPFEQLLGVLPAQSKTLLPKIYQALMTDDVSPIVKYYPTDFDSDMNDKRQSWEAVVLIPFIDEKLLLAAMKEGTIKLTSEELIRNSKGFALSYKYVKEETGPIHSPANIFPSLPVCHTFETKINEIGYDPTILPNGIHPEAKRDAIYQGFPTLKSKAYLSEVTKAEVKVFDVVARDVSLVLHMESPKLQQSPNFLIGKAVWVNWPNLTLALVTGISDQTVRYRFNEVRFTVEPDMSYNASRQHTIILEKLIETHRRYKGIILTESPFIIWAKTMEGTKVRCDSKGNVVYENQWSDIEKAYPLQTIMEEGSVIVVGENQGTSYKEFFSVGQKVVCLKGEFYGRVGTIIGHDSRSVNVTVEFKFTKDVAKDLITEIGASQVLMKNEFFNGFVAARISGMPLNVFSRLTGSIFISVEKKRKNNTKNVNKSPSEEDSEAASDSCEEEGMDLDKDDDNTSMVDIGLKLKFNKKNMEVRGYTKKINNSWCYSEKTLNLVKEYCKAFPELVKYLNETDLNGKNSHRAREIFPRNSNENINSIVDWIDVRGIHQLQQVPLGSEILEEEDIENIWKQLLRLEQTKKEERVAKCKVNPSLLYKPGSDSGCISGLPKFDLLDRIVIVDPGMDVPLGHTGTVVGLINPIRSEMEEAFSIASASSVQQLILLCDPFKDEFEVAVHTRTKGVPQELCGFQQIRSDQSTGSSPHDFASTSSSAKQYTNTTVCTLKKVFPFQVFNITKNSDKCQVVNAKLEQNKSTIMSPLRSHRQAPSHAQMDSIDTSTAKESVEVTLLKRGEPLQAEKPQRESRESLITRYADAVRDLGKLPSDAEFEKFSSTSTQHWPGGSQLKAEETPRQRQSGTSKSKESVEVALRNPPNFPKRFRQPAPANMKTAIESGAQNVGRAASIKPLPAPDEINKKQVNTSPKPTLAGQAAGRSNEPVRWSSDGQNEKAKKKPSKSPEHPLTVRIKATDKKSTVSSPPHTSESAHISPMAKNINKPSHSSQTPKPKAAGNPEKENMPRRQPAPTVEAEPARNIRNIRNARFRGNFKLLSSAIDGIRTQKDSSRPNSDVPPTSISSTTETMPVPPNSNPRGICQPKPRLAANFEAPTPSDPSSQ